MIKVPGIAVSASQVRSKASVLSLRCRSCDHTKSNIVVRAGLEGYTLPRKCEAEQTAAREQCPLDPYILVPEMCQCRDFQNIKLQESPDSIPTAEMPRHIGLYMERSLVDQIVPGNRVTVTGIFQIKRQQVKGILGYIHIKLQSLFKLRNHPYFRIFEKCLLKFEVFD